MRSALLLTLLALPALAEAQKPKLAVHPLVLEGVDSKRDRDELSALLPGIIINVGKVEIASPSDVDSELKKKGQAFCSPENLFKCLSYIADHTSSVHAIRIELRRGGRPNSWEIIANVVCVDGSVERQPDVFVFTQSDSVKFLPIAKSKLEEFVATLRLSELPVSPPAKPAPIATEPPKSDVPMILNPPPFPPPQPSGTSPVRVASYVIGGAAIVALAIGGGFAVVAKGDGDQLHVVNNLGIPRAELQHAQDADGHSHAAAGLLVVGGVLAATAITLFLVSDSGSDTVIAPAVVPGGAGVVFSSRF